MNADALKKRTQKDLAQLAKKRGVTGWHGLKKDQLVRALLRLVKKPIQVKKPAAKPPAAVKSRAATGHAGIGHAGNGHAGNGHSAGKKATLAARRSGTPPTAKAVATNRAAAVKVAPPKERPRDSRIAKRIEAVHSKHERMKNLTSRSANGKTNGAVRDRLVAMVRDPFWLHAYWELSRHGVERAEAALGQEWHTAKPILRLLEVATSGTTSSTEKVLRDIDIHGGVNNWYVDVQDPPQSYRLDIGYLAASGRMFVLARSNVVSTPRAGASDSIDENWTGVAENFDKIYAMSGGYDSHGSSGDLQELFEERLRRPMGSPMMVRFGAGAGSVPGKKRGFLFDVDAELIVFGKTEPDAHVTLQGDPVKLREDGSFTVRFSMPNCRQVIPAVACSANGVEQRTIVLAVERNTKTMEPVVRDGNE